MLSYELKDYATGETIDKTANDYNEVLADWLYESADRQKLIEFRPQTNSFNVRRKLNKVRKRVARHLKDHPGPEDAKWASLRDIANEFLASS